MSLRYSVLRLVALSSPVKLLMLAFRASRRVNFARRPRRIGVFGDTPIASAIAVRRLGSGTSISAAASTRIDISHSSTVPAFVPEARVPPSGENDTDLTPSICQKVAKLVRVVTSHSSTVPSHDPEASVLPSGENTTDSTKLACPQRVAIFARVATSHSSTFPYAVPEARVVPSGENDTDSIGPV